MIEQLSNSNKDESMYSPCLPDGLVSYSIEDGEMRGKDNGLRDLTYDGIREGNRLYGGLGQLTDGEMGHNNFRVDVRENNGGNSTSRIIMSVEVN